MGLGSDMLLGAGPIAQFLLGSNTLEARKAVLPPCEPEDRCPSASSGGHLMASRKALTTAYEKLTQPK